jgi:hypothetical protein
MGQDPLKLYLAKIFIKLFKMFDYLKTGIILRGHGREE